MNRLGSRVFRAFLQSCHQPLQGVSPRLFGFAQDAIIQSLRQGALARLREMGASLRALQGVREEFLEAFDDCALTHVPQPEAAHTRGVNNPAALGDPKRLAG